MVAIDIDFELYKSLTLRRASEHVTYSDVIRELLESVEPNKSLPVSLPSGCTFKGVDFPEGTQFRATYKGRTYFAEIRNGLWIGADGTDRNSPSEAAHAITGNSVNGWRFWECKRPGDHSWRLINELR